MTFKVTTLESILTDAKNSNFEKLQACIEGPVVAEMSQLEHKNLAPQSEKKEK